MSVIHENGASYPFSFVVIIKYCLWGKKKKALCSLNKRDQAKENWIETVCRQRLLLITGKKSNLFYPFSLSKENIVNRDTDC